MRPGLGLSLGVSMAIMAAMPHAARADHAPRIVVPGRMDVPVIIDGVEASWTVVDGDWGLYRPGHRGVTMESGPLLTITAPPYGYFPSTGRPPRYGRDEVLPRAVRGARRAESYHRSWSAHSSGPAQRKPFFDDDLPRDPPPVIPAPRLK